MVPGVGIEPT